MNDFDDFGGCLADEEFFKEEQFYEKQSRKKSRKRLKAMNDKKYPYLAYSTLTECVYIVLGETEKIDVTSQYEFIVKERESVEQPPFTVGQKVWLVVERLDGKVEVLESKIIRHTKTEKIELFSCYVDCPEIGNSIEYSTEELDFICRTKEEAEKVREEYNGCK